MQILSVFVPGDLRNYLRLGAVGLERVIKFGNTLYRKTRHDSQTKRKCLTKISCHIFSDRKLLPRLKITHTTYLHPCLSTTEFSNSVITLPVCSQVGRSKRPHRLKLSLCQVKGPLKVGSQQDLNFGIRLLTISPDYIAEPIGRLEYSRDAIFGSEYLLLLKLLWWPVFR